MTTYENTGVLTGDPYENVGVDNWGRETARWQHDCIHEYNADPEAYRARFEAWVDAQMPNPEMLPTSYFEENNGVEACVTHPNRYYALVNEFLEQFKYDACLDDNSPVFLGAWEYLSTDLPNSKKTVGRLNFDRLCEFLLSDFIPANLIGNPPFNCIPFALQKDIITLIKLHYAATYDWKVSVGGQKDVIRNAVKKEQMIAMCDLPTAIDVILREDNERMSSGMPRLYSDDETSKYYMPHEAIDALWCRTARMLDFTEEEARYRLARFCEIYESGEQLPTPYVPSSAILEAEGGVSPQPDAQQAVVPGGGLIFNKSPSAKPGVMPITGKRQRPPIGA